MTTGRGDPEILQLCSPGAVPEDALVEPLITHQGLDGHIPGLSCPFPRFGLVALAECQ